MSATIKDIAKRTGKSITTVSRALNDYDDVSPATKAQIKQVADELGYSPNRVAQRLQKRRTDIIGLILPTFGPRFADPFFSELLAGVGNKAAEFGYDLLVSTRAPGKNEMDAYRQKVRGGEVDGFIVVRTRLQDPRIEYLKTTNVPFAVFGRTESALDYLYVDEDGAYGMRCLVEHLAAMGHRRLAYISAPPELTFAAYRKQGVIAGLQTASLTIDDDMIVTGDLTQRGGFTQAARLLDHPSPPTAIIACNDLMAFGAMSAAQGRGLVVGRDIAVTGFDDIPMAEHTHPPLTTVRQPIYQIGGMVCEMLLLTLTGETPKEQQILLKPELIVRQSTGAVPAMNSAGA